MNRGKALAASESTSSSFSWYRGGFSGVPNLENIFRKKTWKGILTPPITPCLMEVLWNVPPPPLLPTPHRGLDFDTCDYFDHLLYFLIRFFSYTVFIKFFPPLTTFYLSTHPTLCSLFQKKNPKKGDKTHRKKIKTSRRLRRHNKSKQSKKCTKIQLMLYNLSLNNEDT